MRYHIMPFHTITCHALPCHAVTIPSSAIPYHIPCHTILCHAIPYHTLSPSLSSSSACFPLYHVSTLPYYAKKHHTLSPASGAMQHTIVPFQVSPGSVQYDSTAVLDPSPVLSNAAHCVLHDRAAQQSVMM